MGGSKEAKFCLQSKSGMAKRNQPKKTCLKNLTLKKLTKSLSIFFIGPKLTLKKGSLFPNYKLMDSLSYYFPQVHCEYMYN